MFKKNFWDKIAGVYDFFERAYNRKCYDGTGERVAQEIDSEDIVLECACGTGSISKPVAKKCKNLFATDMSVNMMKRARKNCSDCGNIVFKKSNIMSIKAKNDTFDKVVAGNVIHLLDEPYKAVDELLRVCKKGGKVIIPTYINMGKQSSELLIKLFDFAGAHFTKQFDRSSYEEFFTKGGYNVSFDVVEGKMPCAIAIIKK
ncbi:class I SAM-dependent methyltransferase [Ruminococcus sp.]|uniref:class I SAM-dependent methyltransferase n=1 Tax=Ruminococcus sp. TaxID=41978 RepID=UPI0025E0B750|nr:class I SAM-dependent methyltransferase [Ruminococcus sp.]